MDASANCRSVARSKFLACAAAGAAAASATAVRAQTDTHTLRLSMPLDVASVQGQMATRWAQSLARRSSGRLKVEIYPNGQLAKETASIEGLKTGTVDVAIQTSTAASSFAPRMRIFDFPFLFRDIRAVYRVVDSSIGSDLFGDLDGQGIVGLTWGPSGFRQYETTAKTIVTPDDMQGLRIRIQASPMAAAVIQALRAIPVTIEFPEVPVALAQHTVDGLEAGIDSFVSSKLYEVVKHIAISNHAFASLMLLVSKQKLQSLSLDLQTIVREESRALTGPWRALYDRQLGQNVAFLRSKGAVFSEINEAAFRKVTDPVYTTFAPQLGSEWVDRVRKLAS